MNDPVPELLNLLHGPVVLLGWPKGSKGEQRRWGHLTVSDMTPEYLSRLKDKNIGVVLGEKSGGLCAIDLDEAALVEPFLELNQHLRTTLQTHGNRGRTFWIRFRSDYPKRSNKLLTQSGGEIGEFRSNGNQSIISGIHPTGKPYVFTVREPVLEVEFNSIRWPDEIATPPKLAECTEEPLVVRKSSSGSSGPSVSSVSSVSSVHDWFYSVHTVEGAVQRTLPETVHQNNVRLFEFARGIKAIEAQTAKFSPERLREAFDQWHVRARPFLRPDQSKEEYFIEFMNGYQRAKFPLGSVALPKAWKLAQEEPLPAEAREFQSSEFQRIIALCWQLQMIAGDEPFYLSSRVCQKLLGHANHSTAAKWLSALCGIGILQEAEKGNSRRATRYRYIVKKFKSDEPSPFK